MSEERLTEEERITDGERRTAEERVTEKERAPEEERATGEKRATEEERVSEADAVRLFIEEEGMLFEFGRGDGDDGATERIETVSRVLVPPRVCRRLAMSLAEAVRRLPREQPGAARGPIASAPPPPDRVGSGSTAASRVSFIGTGAPGRRASPKAQPPTPAAAKKQSLEELLEPTRDMPSSRAPAPAAAEHAARLLGAVSELGAPYVQERSFRMRQGELLPNRFLLSVGRPSDGSASDEALSEAFRAIGLPPAALQATQPDLPQARCIHFGFEGDGDGPLLKVYLEVGGPDKIAGFDPAEEVEAAGRQMPEPVLEHVAYKWKPTAGAEAVVGRYWWYPHLTAAQIRSRVEATYDGAASQSRDIAFGVIALAAERMPERDIHYLEIEEEGNARRSYSINFYDADLRIRDLHPLLSRMRALYEIAPGRFQVLYDQIKKRRFGHLAGGVHRNGADFFNVYYGPQLFDRGAGDGPWRGALLRHGGARESASAAGGGASRGNGSRRGAGPGGGGGVRGDAPVDRR